MIQAHAGTQGELKHHAVKARFARTDHKQYVKQMTHIEHHQARISRIQSQTLVDMEVDDDNNTSCLDI